MNSALEHTASILAAFLEDLAPLAETCKQARCLCHFDKFMTGPEGSRCTKCPCLNCGASVVCRVDVHGHEKVGSDSVIIYAGDSVASDGEEDDCVDTAARRDGPVGRVGYAWVPAQDVVLCQACCLCTSSLETLIQSVVEWRRIADDAEEAALRWETESFEEDLLSYGSPMW
jgi:hypothetical protein